MFNIQEWAKKKANILVRLSVVSRQAPTNSGTGAKKINAPVRLLAVKSQAWKKEGVEGKKKRTPMSAQREKFIFSIRKGFYCLRRPFPNQFPRISLVRKTSELFQRKGFLLNFTAPFPNVLPTTLSAKPESYLHFKKGLITLIGLFYDCNSKYFICKTWKLSMFKKMVF